MEEAKAKCPTCGSEFPAGATFCPKCGYTVPASSPAAPPEQQAAPPTPQSNVVYVQPPAVAPRESNWGPWAVVAAILILVGGGFALWSGGYFGGGSPSAPPPSSVTIDNSPRMTTETPPAPAVPAASETPAPTSPPATPPPATPPPATVPPVIPPSKTPDIDIISVEGQALEKNSVEWKYGYTLRVRNNKNSSVTASFRIQFLDDQGFAVDDAVMNDLVIPANAELTFKGDDLIKAPLAERIRTLLAEVR